MKRKSLVLALLLSFLVVVLQPAPPGAAQEWAVYFSPHGGCTKAIVEELGKAQDSLLVQAYFFTSHPITKAIVDANARGVKTKVILDKSANLLNDLTPSKTSSLPALLIAGISTWIDGKHSIAHNKIMIIDGKTVITGSFNFTKKAEEENAENLLIIHDKSLASRYETNWRNHQEHATLYAEPK